MTDIVVVVVVDVVVIEVGRMIAANIQFTVFVIKRMDYESVAAMKQWHDNNDVQPVNSGALGFVRRLKF